MLLLMFYCILFFAMPAVGMIALALRKANRARNKEGFFEEEDHSEWRKALKTKKVASPVFENKKIIDYQLIESQIHQPLHFKEINPRAPCRAGP